MNNNYFLSEDTEVQNPLARYPDIFVCTLLLFFKSSKLKT